MKTKTYYREQLMELKRNAVRWAMIGGALGLAMGLFIGVHAMEERGILRLILSVFVFTPIVAAELCGVPVGLQIARRISDTVGNFFLILPILGWVFLLMLKLTVIVYGGWWATAILAIYYWVKMRTAPEYEA